MPQFRIVVPPNVREGQVVRASVGRGYTSGGKSVRLPNPPTVNVRVPAGAHPGDAFVFELSQEQLDEMVLSALGAPGGGGGSGSNNKPSRPSSEVLASASSSSSAPLSTSTSTPITQTRLVHYTDSFSEVFLGFLIGMSMVFGFFAGVLYVTEPL